jgi:glucose/mannose transport system permease protein
MSRAVAWPRVAVYAALVVLAAFFLAPLLVTVLTSVRSNAEMAQRSLIGWPQHLDFSNFAVAWSSFCIAERCTGIAPFMANSAEMAIPATIISTLLGAVTGYAIALWRFRGDTVIFGLVTLGVFLPEQMRLIPWTIVLRDTGLSGSVAGLVMIHTIQGLSFTTLFCRNYYLSIPQDLMARTNGLGISYA